MYAMYRTLYTVYWYSVFLPLRISILCIFSYLRCIFSYLLCVFSYLVVSFGIFYVSSMHLPCISYASSVLASSSSILHRLSSIPSIFHASISTPLSPCLYLLCPYLLCPYLPHLHLHLSPLHFSSASPPLPHSPSSSLLLRRSSSTPRLLLHSPSPPLHSALRPWPLQWLAVAYLIGFNLPPYGITSGDGQRKTGLLVAF